MTEAEKIAKGLTKAQREAIRGLWQDAARHAPYHQFRSTPANRKAWRELMQVGVVNQEDGGFDLLIVRGRPVASVVLSPLGLAVRGVIAKAPQP